MFSWFFQQRATMYLPQANKYFPVSPVLFSTQNAQVFCAMCSVYV